MKTTPAAVTSDPQEEIAALVRQLHETQQRLQELTGGQVDAVVHPGGQTYLLREAQGKLRESEGTQRKLAQTMLAILNALPAHVALLDAKGGIISVNEAWRKHAVSGLPQHAIFSSDAKYLEVCERATGEGAEIAHEAAAGIRKILAGTTRQFSLEYPCHSTGQERWFSLLITPVGGKRPSAAVVMHLDITERKLAAESVRHSEERFRGMFTVAAMGIAIRKPTGHYLEANEAFCKMVGYTEDELRGLGPDGPTHPEDRPFSNRMREEFLAGRQEGTVLEKRYVKKNGDILWARVSISATHTASGDVATFIVVAEDVTERRRAEEALRSTASSLAASQRIAQLGSWEMDLVDPDNLRANPLRWSDEMYRIMGYLPHSVNVTPDFYLSHIPGEDGALVEHRLMALLHDGQPHSYFYPVKRSDGQARIIHAEAQVLSDETTGRPVKLIGTVHDVTATKQNEAQLVQKTALLEAQLHSTLDGILIVDNQGNKILQNQRSVDIWKYPKDIAEEVPQRRRLAWIINQTKNPRPFAEKVAYLYAHPNEVSRDEIELIDGRFIDRYTAPVVGEDGRHFGRIWVYRDITDRRVAELRAAEQLDLITMASRVGKLGAWAAEYPGPKLLWSDEIYRIIEVERDYQPTHELSLNFFTPTSRKKLEEAIEKKRPFDLELELITAKGNKRWVRSTSSVEMDHDEVRRIYGILQDITERKQQEGRFRRLVESNVQGILFWNRQGDVVDANDAFLDLVGYSREELKAGQVSWKALTPPEFERYDQRALEQIAATGVCTPYEKEFIVKDGSRVPVFLGSASFPDNPDEGVCFTIDLTEQKKSEARLRRLVESNVQGVMFWNSQGEVTAANDAFLHIAGYSREDLDAGHINWRNITPPEYADRDERALAEIAAKGACTAYEKEYIRKDGTRIPVLIGAASFEDDPNQGVRFVLDLTEQKKLEHQFLRAQRMESIGTLAGGIAHDLNNILAPIMMAVQILKLSVTNAQAKKILETIEISSKRGADIVRQVLSFARGVEGERLEIQPKHLLKDIEAIIKDTFPKNIRWEVSIAGDSWTVIGDPTQLHQILLNLCVNARDAMPEGGTMSLVVENVLLDEQYAAMNIEAKVGQYVTIGVTDTGTGIPPGIIDKIFDPFFTTKEVGKGTGLGLSTVMAIVKSHGGFINVYSEPGKGSCFKIYLPAIEVAAPVKKHTGPLATLPRGKGELVLIIDDEASILTITTQTLEAFGYRTITAHDGAEAVAIYAQQKEGIAVVLTDMAMPIMDGPATIRALMKINPEVRIIAATGLRTEGSEAKATETGIRYFLSKPYTAATLLKTLRMVLDVEGG